MVVRGVTSVCTLEHTFSVYLQRGGGGEHWMEQPRVRREAGSLCARLVAKP